MAHSHYVMDCYFPVVAAPGRFRREALRLDAADDAAAVAEAERIDAWKGTNFYELRSITSSSRSGDKLIYSSRQNNAESDEELVPVG
jgi:hypothetical protein